MTEPAPRRIRVLDPLVADRIAAGEVIERPSSVVKELVENALDAGATQITVDVQGTGSTLVRVGDDGEGIHPEDLRLAVQRFATSKIVAADDLSAIQTLGFRGEALPSIAAVSHLEITTGVRGAASGRHIRVAGGEVQDEHTVGGPPGTVVTVRHLFFNTPARRKFLKSSAREFALIVDTMHRLALAHPHVAFRLTHEGKEVLRLPAGSSTDRAAAVFGGAVTDQSLFVNRTEDGIAVRGWLGRPELARATRRQQYLFVNGRPIHSRMVAAAVDQACAQIIPAGQHPLYALFLTLSAGAVDVNVHPRKLEVRFEDDHRVFTAVARAVRETLHVAQLLRPAPGAAVPAVAAPGSLPLESAPVTAAHVREAEVGSQGRLPAMRLLGQLHRTYLLAQGADGLIVVDQHAAHERVLYERLLSVRQSTRTTQQLVTPQAVTLDPGELMLLQTSGGALAELGFDLEPFGERTILIRGAPQLVVSRSAEQLLRDLLAEAAGGGEFRAAGNLLERLTITTACHSAIKAGDPLSTEQMLHLLSDLAATRDPFTCFHGRPTMVTLPVEQVERWFLRR